MLSLSRHEAEGREVKHVVPGWSWRVAHSGLEANQEKTVTVVPGEMQIKTAARHTQ